MSSQPIPRVTPREYLLGERQAEHRSEYFDGEVLVMEEATYVHNLIVANVATLLARQLAGQPSTVAPSSLRLQVGAGRHYFYPDVMVICGEPVYADEQHDTLLNPTVIVEVLSDSTINYDRGEKFLRYRTLSSFAEYVVVSQRRYHVEHFVRQKDNTWLLSDHDQIESSVFLESIACRLQLADIYEKVEIAGAGTI